LKSIRQLRFLLLFPAFLFQTLNRPHRAPQLSVLLATCAMLLRSSKRKSLHPPLLWLLRLSAAIMSRLRYMQPPLHLQLVLQTHPPACILVWQQLGLCCTRPQCRTITNPKSSSTTYICTDFSCQWNCCSWREPLHPTVPCQPSLLLSLLGHQLGLPQAKAHSRTVRLSLQKPRRLQASRLPQPHELLKNRAFFLRRDDAPRWAVVRLRDRLPKPTSGKEELDRKAKNVCIAMA
jgi:hypothetical protein